MRYSGLLAALCGATPWGGIALVLAGALGYAIIHLESDRDHKP